MIIHRFDSNGFYVKSREARLDPEETKIQGNDIFLKPANSSFDELPITDENEIVQLIGAELYVVPDYKGVCYYEQNGTKVIISDFDVSIPEGCLLIDPPSIYHDKHDGISWIENTELKAQAILLGEIASLKSEMLGFMAYHFSMTQVLFETLIAKGIFAASEINDGVLKDKYAEWKPKIERYRALND